MSDILDIAGRTTPTLMELKDTASAGVDEHDAAAVKEEEEITALHERKVW